jgi:predicted NUDIX family NTP pyrophosphohydrolase
MRYDGAVTKVSAGLLLYRHRGEVQVLLVHPGGPFWAKKDLASWSIPKGEAVEHEDLLDVAVREVREETGFTVQGPFMALLPVKQSGGKIVHAWAVEFDVDAGAFVSNTFRIEWPPRSGRLAEFPEVDRAEWFDRAGAFEKILPSQRPLLDEFFERRRTNSE